MCRISIKKNNLILCFVLIFETILIKFLQYKIFSEKYFFDSKKILAVMNGSTVTDKGYSFTANFFNCVNFFHLNSIKQWSVLISFFSLVVFLIYFSRKELDVTSYIYIGVSFALMNIYVFNLSKDIIQLIIFMIVYYIYSMKNIAEIKKVFLSVVIFIIESFYFRSYYLIIGILDIIFYCIYIYFFNAKKKNTFFSCVIYFLLFIFMIYILQMISNENYIILVNTRNNSNLYRDSADAFTMIKDFFPNISFSYFLLNYIINAFRILFPVELFVKGYKYIPFIIFQIFFSIVLLKNAVNIKREKAIYIFLLMSFILVSIIYEPDFGSVIRHESVLMLFVLKILEKKKGYKKNEKSISNYTNI